VPRRADARQNYERILTAAKAAVADQGASASLEEIARSAGVGSATLHRHFPSRWALLQLVFEDRVRELCERAAQLANGDDPQQALHQWLMEFAEFGATTKGLARTIIASADEGPARSESCEALLTAAGEQLFRKARQAGAIRSDVTTHEVLTLLSAISLAIEDSSTAREVARRLATIAIGGIYAPQQPAMRRAIPNRSSRRRAHD
jgi:AcrR family transcriptional regulator